MVLRAGLKGATLESVLLYIISNCHADYFKQLKQILNHIYAHKKCIFCLKFGYIQPMITTN